MVFQGLPAVFQVKTVRSGRRFFVPILAADVSKNEDAGPVMDLRFNKMDSSLCSGPSQFPAFA